MRVIAKSPNPHQIAMYGHIARVLQNFMAKKDWNVGDLNHAMGFDRSYSAGYQWVNGKSGPGPKLCIKLAKVTGIPVAELTPHKLPRLKGSALVTLPVSNPSSSLPGPLVATRKVAASEVLSFGVASDGQATIKLNATMPMHLAVPLLRMLLDAGLVFSKGDTNGDESET